VGSNNLSFEYEDYRFTDDWEEFELRELLRLVERPVKLIDEENYNLITVKRNFGGIESRGKLTGKEILVKTQFEIRENDFVISKRQIAHGACAIVPKSFDGAIVSNEYDVFNCANKLLPLFFTYYVQLPFMRRYFYIASHGVHIEKLRFKTDDWLQYRIRIPSIEEQQRIVTILSTWERVIHLNEKLIQQKKQQRKWFRQVLLNGQKRFPGFKDKWQKVRIGDVATINDESLSENTPPDLQFRYIELSSVDRGHIFWPNQAIKFINLPSRARRLFKKGDILMSTVRPYLMGFAYIDQDYERCVCSTGFAVIRAAKNICSQYVYYILFSDDVSHQMNKCLIGTNYPALNNIDVLNLQFKIPSLAEQKIIAQILSMADYEIDLLERQIIELTKQKMALMQLLLTGALRVNI